MCAISKDPPATEGRAIKILLRANVRCELDHEFLLWSHFELKCNARLWHDICYIVPFASVFVSAIEGNYVIAPFSLDQKCDDARPTRETTCRPTDYATNERDWLFRTKVNRHCRPLLFFLIISLSLCSTGWPVVFKRARRYARQCACSNIHRRRLYPAYWHCSLDLSDEKRRSALARGSIIFHLWNFVARCAW